MKHKEENLKTALAYARLGWHVFPIHFITKDKKCTCKGRTKKCAPGKHPIGHLVPDGLDSATTDVGIISSWWNCVPYANIGIRTGEVSDLFVLDVDPKSDGDVSLKTLEDKGMELSEVFVLTGSGGTHYYYSYPDGKKAVENSVGFLPGLDIRADRGYVVAPPSNHISGGTYQWGV